MREYNKLPVAQLKKEKEKEKEAERVKEE